MRDMARHARQILAARRRDAAEQPVFPGYFSFDGADRPGWWTEEHADPRWGRVLGVHEYERGRRTHAIVVADVGLAVLGDGPAVVWLPYAEVASWDRLSKEPIARRLLVRTKSGDAIELRFDEGGAFAFVQFLIRAIKDATRAPGG